MLRNIIAELEQIDGPQNASFAYSSGAFGLSEEIRWTWGTTDSWDVNGLYKKISFNAANGMSSGHTATEIRPVNISSIPIIRVA